MNKKLLYISLISKKDLDDIDNAVLMYGGDGIIIEKTSSGFEIRLDDRYLSDIVIDEVNKFIATNNPWHFNN